MIIVFVCIYCQLLHIQHAALKCSNRPGVYRDYTLYMVTPLSLGLVVEDKTY